MEAVTLKVNMIVDGQYLSRGTILDKAILPKHLRIRKFINLGANHVDKVIPDDMIEVGEIEVEEEDLSPMREFTMPHRKLK